MKPIGTQSIHTGRLLLRAIQLEDAERLVVIRSLAMSRRDADRAVRKMVEELEKPFVFHWVITLDDEVIGRVKAWDVAPYNGYLQLGYDIAPQHRGHGYMTEAMRAVIRYLMLKAEVNRVFCSVRAGNAASRRVCEKCGMIHEGTMRQHYARQDGGYDDVCIYGILREDIMEEPNGTEY